MSSNMMQRWWQGQLACEACSIAVETMCIGGIQVEGKDAKEVKDVLAQEHGIMVRHYQKERLDGFIRISVGKPQHTDYLITSLRSMV
jgi:hypothetical protein